MRIGFESLALAVALASIDCEREKAVRNMSSKVKKEKEKKVRQPPGPNYVYGGFSLEKYNSIVDFLKLKTLWG